MKGTARRGNKSQSKNQKLTIFSVQIPLTNGQQPAQLYDFHDLNHYMNENIYGYGPTKEMENYGRELTLAQM